MKLQELLEQKRSAILKNWLKSVVDSYPADARRFLSTQKDRFANPVGFTLTKETEKLFDELLRGVDPERISPILDRIVRIRAVQNFTPKQALSFIFALKGVIRDQLKKGSMEDRFRAELVALESQVDEVALLGFEIYVKCRETLYEMKANQMKNQVSKLLERAGLISEVPKWRPDEE